MTFLSWDCTAYSRDWNEERGNAETDPLAMLDVIAPPLTDRPVLIAGLEPR
jgi:hypothetical protein